MRRLPAAVVGAACVFVTLIGAQSVPADVRVRLRVTNPEPRQFEPVKIKALGAPGRIATGYRFSYGDGVIETSYQSVMSHAYRTPGRYRASVTELFAQGASKAAPPVTIRVRDGIPPIVKILTPVQGQTIRPAGAGFDLRGTAADLGAGASGLRYVELALQPLGATAADCLWYDGARSLVPSACNRPLFFRATRRGGRWSFRLGSDLAFPRGPYALRARGIDRAGNASEFYVTRLKTIVGFRLK